MRFTTQAVILLSTTVLAAPQGKGKGGGGLGGLGGAGGGAGGLGGLGGSGGGGGGLGALGGLLGGGGGGLGGLLSGLGGGGGGLGGLLGGLGGLAPSATSEANVYAAAPTAAANCQPNAAEKFNLQHHHDINTGDVIIGERILKGYAKFPGGSGCSPVWAGGKYDDSKEFRGGKYPTWLTRSSKEEQAVSPAKPTTTGAARLNPGAAYGAHNHHN